MFHIMQIKSIKCPNNSDKKPLTNLMLFVISVFSQYNKLSAIAIAISISGLSSAIASQSPLLFESLNRSLVAVQSDEGIFLSWRILASEYDSVEFYLYRNDSLITETPITGKSNYLDTKGSSDDFYYVRDTVRTSSDITSGCSDAVAVWSDGYEAGSGTGYKEIPLQLPGDDYKPNDISVADLDGDGEYEYIVKMQATKRDNSQTGETDKSYFQAYKLNGTLMWTIDLGVNIRAGSHYSPFIVYDFDGDGKAEMGLKTAPGTIDGTGNYLSDGPASNDTDNVSYVDGNGLILYGNEYLTVFDGETGAELSTVEYVPERGDVNDWGDSYGNRSERYLACAAYFDSLPSLVMCRGYYTRSVLAAWDYNKTDGLTLRWTFDTDDSTTVGKDGVSYKYYAGQGAHSLSVGDVDEDGKDEIIYGAMAIDDDGVGLWTSGNNHGDATHLGDFIPDSAGLEYCMPSESAYSTNKLTGEKIPGVWFAHAATGKIIWQIDVSKTSDVGRAFVDDVAPDHDGIEVFSSLGDVYDYKGDEISHSSEYPAQNFGSWWDGDITREVLSGCAIKEWSLTEKYSLLEPDDCKYNNDTKANPAISGDILGDWREEVIWRTEDNEHLRIYTTTDTTEYGLYTLVQDPQYRLSLAWQNVGYNQPPHTGFFIGEGMDTPPTPNIKVIDPDVDPKIDIISPSVGFEFETKTTINVSYHLTDLRDTTTLYLYNDSTILDTIEGAPYFTSFKDSDTLSAGCYSIYALAYNADQNPIYSDTIIFSVGDFDCLSTDVDDIIDDINKVVIDDSTSSIVSSSLEKNIIMFPIPASSSVNITSSGNELINTIVVYDLTGKQVIYDTYSANEVTLGISSLKSGLYMIKLSTSTDVYMKKLLVN